jgi:hypothetical protein
MSETQAPQIVTVDTLKTFKDELLDSIGITISNKSLIHSNNTAVTKTATSAVFGSNHKVDIGTNAGLKNVLVSGMGNIASTWNQTVLGQFNAADENALFIIGTGSSDTNRKTAFKVLKDNKININGEIYGDTGKVVFVNPINYKETTTESFDSLNSLYSYLEEIPDTELIPAKVIKELLLNIKDETGTALKNFNVLSDDLNETDIENKTWNIEQIKAYCTQISPQIAEGAVISLNNKLSALQSEISYLLSCLTVTRKFDENNDEYFIIGLASAALDMDTEIDLSQVTTPAVEEEV